MWLWRAFKCFLMWGHLTWPGDLTLKYLVMKFLQRLRNNCIKRCAKNSGAPCRRFKISARKTGGVQAPPGPARVNLTYDVIECIEVNGTEWRDNYSARLSNAVLFKQKIGPIVSSKARGSKPGMTPPVWRAVSADNRTGRGLTRDLERENCATPAWGLRQISMNCFENIWFQWFDNLALNHESECLIKCIFFFISWPWIMTVLISSIIGLEEQKPCLWTIETSTKYLYF